MSLINKIEEQLAIGFTGKINILDKSNDQLLGVVLLDDGVIVNAKYGDHSEDKAMIDLIISDTRGVVQFKFIVEPEIIPVSKRSTIINLENIKARAARVMQDIGRSDRLRPPESLSLGVDDKFVSNGDDIDWLEFKALCAVLDYPIVKDIYENSDLHERELTSALISLREKKAIVVRG